MPQKTATTNNVSSASYDASSGRNSRSKIPRPSLTGHPSTLSRQNTTSRNATQKTRNPLAPLGSNDGNSLRRHNGTTKVAGTRSVSEASIGSLLACGTVQQRSKSSSPSKKQQTLEWKRRLVHGDVGYGDQTDLFGPSGLENIFARSRGPENEVPKAKNRIGWLQKSDAPIPSSPPPWPSCFVDESQTHDPDALDAVVEEGQVGDGSEYAAYGHESSRSNPFDLESSVRTPWNPHRPSSAASPFQSSPDKAFIEPTQDEVAQNRTISGQTELEQEDFSPVFVSKHKTVSGQVSYAALDSHLVKQFQRKKVDLRHPSQQQLESSIPVSDERLCNDAERSTFTDGPSIESVPAAPDLSFSENLPTGSPFPNLGTNVQLTRGGYSQHGSFKRRPLSPSPSTVGDSLIPDASGLLSPLPPPEQRPPAPTPPPVPTRPVQQDEPKSRSSGSPLKLFDAHDTFTNNRLLRRMSQLNPDGTVRRGALDEARNDERCDRNVSNGSSFGNGELDDYIFNAEITITSASDSEKDDSDRSPGSEIPAPGSKSPLAFRVAGSHEVKDTFKMKRKLSKQRAAASKGSTLESQTKPTLELHATVEDASESHRNFASTTEQDRRYGEGKRPPTSPFKSPTPKRRRTLHASELERGVAAMNDSYYNQLQEPVSSCKRKDACEGEEQDRANPEILAQRRMLRPRNPTPSQRRRQQIEAELREAADEFAEQEPERLEAVMEQIESSMASDEHSTLEQQAQTLASEVAAFTLRVQRPSGEQVERKQSVTTQDFLNEAMMVMNLIRAKARPQSNLGSVEESEAEAFRQSLRTDSQQEVSLLRVSRPPSREGTGWRARAPAKIDARVISHLRKFEEKEDVDDTNFIANSIASLQVDNEEQVNDQVVVVDEKANVRITGPPVRQNKEQADSGSRPASQRSQGSTVSTQNSGGTSTGRTIETSSTRKSDNVGTLAPDAVAHLIGDQVGGMTFDKDKQRWVRLSKSPEKTHGSFFEHPSNVTSDDDPFREISDLPVDEQKELRRLSSGGNRVDAQSVDDKVSLGNEVAEKKSEEPATQTRTTSEETVVPRPVTRGSSHNQPNHSSSVPSRYTAFASNQQYEKVETRATSWSDEELAKMSALGKAKQQPLMYAAAEATMAQRTSERHVAEPPAQSDTKMTYPSPTKRKAPKDVASVDHARAVHGERFEEDAEGLSRVHDDAALEMENSNVQDLGSPNRRQTSFKPPLPPRSAYRPANPQISLRKKTLTNTIDCEAQEQNELSIIERLPGDRMLSLSLSVSRPVSTRQQPRKITELQSSPSKGNFSFILSDLPDFTVHEEDGERPSERALATRLAQHAAAEISDRYALTVKGLVKILTDVNEDEPYWEDLKQLDLHERSLASLYGLDDFCDHIQDMDVSSNALQHLTGAPSTIRSLNAISNQLSCLTSWNHLVNLQYLDVSNNHLENLDGLASLIHLRELRADDNRIASINGIFELDGLLTLRLRRNGLQQVDFQNCQLYRLTGLDLSGNQIVFVSSLDRLFSLTDLKLNSNNLSQGVRAEQAMPQLSSLSIKNCSVEHMDVSWCPKLKQLNVDDNRLSSIKHLNTLNELNVLSMRRQTLPEQTAISIFDQPLEASILYLSGNKIPSLRLTDSFLNIRHLELASVGLQELPDDFGLRMPNLRTLNLNFNSLKDIRPILNIQHLEQLTVCGNRLNRLRKSIATFEKMGDLRVLDIRENPLTQGFYASLVSTMSKNTTLTRRFRGQGVEDEEEQAAEMERSRYELPPSDAGADKQHRARLDEDTELRRRVWEALIANSCRELVHLDGLELDRTKVLLRDSVWDRLVELGILRKSQDNVVELLD